MRTHFCSQMSSRTHFYSSRSPLPLPTPPHHGPPRISTQGIDRASEPQCHRPAAQARDRQIIPHKNPTSAQIICLYVKHGLVETSNKLFSRVDHVTGGYLPGLLWLNYLLVGGGRRTRLALNNTNSGNSRKCASFECFVLKAVPIPKKVDSGSRGWLARSWTTPIPPPPSAQLVLGTQGNHRRKEH